jgi:hypothetical protein
MLLGLQPITPGITLTPPIKLVQCDAHEVIYPLEAVRASASRTGCCIPHCSFKISVIGGVLALVRHKSCRFSRLVGDEVACYFLVSEKWDRVFAF